jgi:prepilin-type processing-associated H-X9-DG protein
MPSHERFTKLELPMRNSIACRRRGYTVKELIAVVVIILVLGALLLPSTRRAGESARRSQCSNNLKQIGLACHNYESTYKVLPTGGVAPDFASFDERQSAGLPPDFEFRNQSTFLVILDFMEGGCAVREFDWRFTYHGAAAPRCTYPDYRKETFNSFEAKRKLEWLLCPSNPYINVLDPEGYGKTDYMPTTYTDIDPQPDANGMIGLRNRAKTAAGCLSVGGTSFEDITDGTSNTVMVAESAGRLPETAVPFMCGEFADDLCAQGKAVADACTKTGRRAFWRWAEPTCAGGVSGQRNNGPTRIYGYVNGNRSPAFGGTLAEIKKNGNCLAPPSEGTNPRCYWSWTNCGPNDEIFAWHNGGANVVMADGSVKLLQTNIRSDVLRYLIARNDGVVPIAEGLLAAHPNETVTEYNQLGFSASLIPCSPKR